jgi:hypothetical protein
MRFLPHIQVLSLAGLLQAGWPLVARPAEPEVVAPPAPPAILLQGDGSWAPWQERLRTLNALTSRLSGDDAAALIRFATQPGVPKDFQPAEWHAYANDAFNVLRRQQPLPEDYPAALLALSANADADDTLRDYAVQHIAVLAETPGPQVDALRAELWRQVSEPAHTRAGTALLGLEPLVKHLPDEQKRLTETALVWAEGAGDVGPGAQVTGLQVCLHQRVKEVLPVARRRAYDEKADAAVRRSCVAILGAMGVADDLNRLATSNLRQAARYQAAVEAAILKIQQREPKS